jgi:fructoselysine-6-phosphate deglycase
MLNFDEDRFLRIQSGAVAQAGAIDAAIAKALDADAPNLLFLGTGGAGILMQPAARLLQTRSTFPTFVEIPAELLAAGSVQLRAGSIVVIPSLSGTTAESIEALNRSKEAGATVIALTAHADSPVAEGADVSIVNFAEDDTSSESFFLQSLLIALSVMHHRGELDSYDKAVAELRTVPELLLEAKRAYETRAEQLAERIKDDPYMVVSGAGGSWPEAYYYGMCILEEMQWMRTRPVHAADFFHGTLELIEPDVRLLLLKGEDAARPLTDRVSAFAAKYTERLEIVDAADVELPGLSDEVRALVSPAVLATLLERVSAHLEVKRDHPLTTRRYYKRVAY